MPPRGQFPIRFKRDDRDRAPAQPVVLANDGPSPDYLRMRAEAEARATAGETLTRGFGITKRKQL